MNNLKCVFFVVFVLFTFFNQAFSSRKISKNQFALKTESKSLGCSDLAEEALVSISGKAMRIFLYTEQKNFTEANLKSIFMCYSAQYYEAVLLDITVLSDKDRLKEEIDKFQNPREVDSTVDNKQQIDSSVNQLRAYYTRYDDEYFLYTPITTDNKLIRVNINSDEYKNFEKTGSSDRLLWDAIKQEKVDDVRNLLRNGVKVNTEKNLETPLMLAVNTGNFEITKLLINYNADINAAMNNGKTALMIAVDNNSMEILDLLVKKGAEINQQDSYGQSAVFFARSKEAIALLIKAGADVNIKDDKGRNVLMLNRVKADFVPLLVEAGINLKVRDSLGRSALDYSILYTDCQRADNLISQNIEIVQSNKFKKTFLSNLVEIGFSKTCPDTSIRIKSLFKK